MFHRRIVFLAVLVCNLTCPVFAQNQKIADSLIKLYNSGVSPADELKLLKQISNKETNPDINLKYSELLIKKATKDSLYDFLFFGYLNKGYALKNKGDNASALEDFFTARKLADKMRDTLNIGMVIIPIADTNAYMGNEKNASKYYEEGIQILRKINDSIKLASALVNAGDFFFYAKKYKEAENYFAESGIIFKNKKHFLGEAYNLGNLGMVYAEQGKDAEAEKNIGQAINMLEELQDYGAISVYLTFMSDIYLKKNQWNTALNYAKRSLDLAQKYGLKAQIGDASLKLSELYEQKGDYKISSKYYKDHIIYRDSVLNLKAIEEMADLRTNYEVSQKQTEVDLLEKESQIQMLTARRQKNIIYAIAAGLVITFLFAMGWFNRYRYVKKTNLIIEGEKNRADQLLNNILPEETALELKKSGKVQAKKFESVTVLFTDFQGFTQYADNLPPEKLVESVGYYFSKFDEIMEKYGLEKIKTIGDSYMCAGGLPYPTPDHAKKTVLAALEIAKFVKDSTNKDAVHYTHFAIRIGINTGPVVAGVVGTKKFAYDIWGDTVNIASRMESNATSGRINISENTYALIKDDFDCEYRGEIEVRNKGMMKMYFVNREKLVLSTEY